MKRGGVLVIGLDGGTWDVMGPLARRGVMPATRRLMEAGRPGTLRSTIPWYTVPGWTTLMTGVNPGTHGLLHWVVSDPSDYFEHRRPGRRFVTSRDIAFPTFWDVAGAAGKRVAIVNMPITYPAWPVNGTMVTGLLTPHGAREGASHPEGLLDRFPEYRVDLSVSREGESPDAPAAHVGVTEYLAELLEVTEARRRLATTLFTDEVDLGVAVFVGPDRISHKAWPEQEAVARGEDGGRVGALVQEYYRALDRAVGELSDMAGPDVTTLVVSDHGFGPPPMWSFGMGSWLRDHGYLRLRREPLQRVIASNRALKRLARLVAAWRAGLPLSISQPPPVDWRQTALYTVAYPYQRVIGITVNRARAKREGWVPEEDVPRLLSRFREELAAVLAPGGAPVVRRIMEREEVAPGARAFPDLLIETEEPFAPDGGLRTPRIFLPNRHRASGMHTRDGAFLAAGARTRGSGEAVADIADVAPSVLALLGIRAPDHMEGRTRDDLLDFPETSPTPPGVRGPSGEALGVTAQEQEEIEAHLSGLGYLDQ